MFYEAPLGAAACQRSLPDFEHILKDGSTYCKFGIMKLSKVQTDTMQLVLAAQKIRWTMLISIATIIVTALIAVFKKGT